MISKKYLYLTRIGTEEILYYPPLNHTKIRLLQNSNTDFVRKAAKSEGL